MPSTEPVVLPTIPAATPVVVPALTPAARHSPSATIPPTPLLWKGPLLVSSGESFAPRSAAQRVLPVFDVGSGEFYPLLQEEPFADPFVWSWSSDGCYLLFSPDREREGVYAVNVATRKTSRLLIRPYGLKFSPSGEWIAYTSPAESSTEVYLLRPDGSQEVRVTNDEKRNWLLGWSPDGKKLFYYSQEQGVRGNGVVEIHAMELPSGEGCTLARYSEPLRRWEDLYLASMADCRVIPLAYSGVITNANWVELSYSTHGRYVAIFLAEEPGEEGLWNARLFLLRTETAGMETVHDQGFASFGYSWSPDGTRLALGARYFDEHSLDAPCVYLIDGETGRVSLLDREPGWNPSWSPDGRMLAVQASTLWYKGPRIYRLDGNEILWLPEIFEHEHAPLLWSPRVEYRPGDCDQK